MSERASVVFMGTPEAAVPTLEALHASTRVIAVMTRPDRPRGRSKRPRPSPVKTAAVALGLVVHQPESRLALEEAAAAVGPVDVGVVVAYGMILPPSILSWPETGFLNVHFSLLPRWRGASPVERAIMAGDATTGVTVMAMDEGLDTGPIVASRSIPIGQKSGGEVTNELADVGADLLVSSLGPWLLDRQSRRQDAEHATYAARLTTADRTVDASMGAEDFVRRVQALAPDRAARLLIDGEPHKLLSVRGAGLAPASARRPGSWFERGGVPHVVVAGGSVAIIEIQPPGKKTMAGEAWLRGRPLPAASP